MQEKAREIECILLNGIEIQGECLAEAFKEHFTQIDNPSVNMNACRRLSRCPDSILLSPTTTSPLVTVFLRIDRGTVVHVILTIYKSGL